MLPDIIVDTPSGQLALVFTGQSSSDSNPLAHGHHCAVRIPDNACFVIRGKEYRHGLTHLYRQADGSWTPATGFVALSVMYRDATPAAREAFVKIARETVRAYVAQHPEVLQRAQNSKIAEDRERTELKIREKESELAKLREQLSALDWQAVKNTLGR